MKCKKYSYIIVLILMLVVGIPKPLANTDDNMCYYISTDKRTLVQYNAQKGKFYIEKRDGVFIGQHKSEPLINNGKDKKDGDTEIEVQAIEKGTCPNYIVYRRLIRSWPLSNSEGMWGFNSSTLAQTFANKSMEVDEMHVYTLSYKNTDGTKISGSDFSDYLSNELDVEVDCNAIFGLKDDPESIRYLVNQILEYPKIIVPILIIVLGMFDFAKAVVAGKEENMKKAQSDFVKRVLMGVAVFFIPVLVDILMYLADIVWAGSGYTSCGL